MKYLLLEISLIDYGRFPVFAIQDLLRQVWRKTSVFWDVIQKSFECNAGPMP